MHPVSESRFLGLLARRIDRRVVVIEAEELRLRISLRHQQRRSAMSAADVGDPRAGLKLRLHAVECRNPVGG